MPMLKLLLLLVGALVIGAGLLHLRQQRLELSNRAARLHRELQVVQNELWHQQLDISLYSSPRVLEQMKRP